MLDFAELRNRILYADESEDSLEQKKTPLSEELTHPLTGFPLFLGGIMLAFVVMDKLKLNILAKEGEYNYRPLVISVFGFLPLGLGIGRLWRGMAASKEAERYEKLVEAAEQEVIKLEEQIESDESSDASQDYASEDWAFHIPALPGSLGFGAEGIFEGQTVGQEPVVYRRPSFEAKTFGW